MRPARDSDVSVDSEWKKGESGTSAIRFSRYISPSGQAYPFKAERNTYDNSLILLLSRWSIDSSAGIDQLRLRASSACTTEGRGKMHGECKRSAEAGV